MAELVVAHLRHTYRGGRTALRDVSLELGTGVTALVGVNGAGKSTLLTIAAGGLRPSRGSVSIAGHDPYRGRARRAALGQVALMPQASTFPRSMTAREVVEYVAWMRGSAPREARAQAVRALEDVGLADRSEVRFGALSGGMQRRVCLAQAIATRPAVMLLDEPSTGLDPQQRQLMVERLRGVGGAVVLSSHVMEDVVDLAERVVVLDEGAVAFSGTVAELVARAPDPSSPRAAEAGFLAVIKAPPGAA